MKVYTRVPVEEWKKMEPENEFYLTNEGLFEFSCLCEKFYNRKQEQVFPTHVLVEKDLIYFTPEELRSFLADYEYYQQKEDEECDHISSFLASKGLTKNKE